MKEQRLLIIAAAVAVVLAIYVSVRINILSRNFEREVIRSMQTTEGYDQKFIDLINSLEEVLASRASFGYKGGKDPMTGKLRRVVIPTATPTTTRRRGPRKGSGPREEAPAPHVDPVKLTAIIYDDEKNKFTAIVMDGERSFSVEVGDNVRGRRITKITAEMVYMEDANFAYKYDIYGSSASRPK